MECTTGKRTISIRSPDTLNPNKKINLRKTPTKDREVVGIMAEENPRGEISAEYAKILEGAPEWFKKPFSFLINTVTEELRKIDDKIEAADAIKEQCNTNTNDLKSLQTKVAKLELSNKNLESLLVRMETLSRKKNLILRGCAESGPSEDTGELVSKFFTDVLQMSDAEKPNVSSVYRIGKPPHLLSTPTKHPRDIMLKFSCDSDRENIWKLRGKLKGFKLTLMEDLPQVTKERRQFMMPYFKAARKNPKVEKCFLSRDCLHIDGKQYFVENISAIPNFIQPKNLPEVPLKTCDGLAFFGKQSFLSNFYSCELNDGAHRFDNVETYFQFKKAMYFKDEQCANLILAAKSPAQAKALSHQIKDFDESMWLPVAEKTMLNACAMKFKQNPDLASKLREIKGIIIQANPKDNFFSCGLPISHSNIENQSKWKGKNVLGHILCRIRDGLA